MTVFGLPFERIIFLDFEFHGEQGYRDGGRPVPVCLVARELPTGRLVRLWQDELGPKPPFVIDDNTLFVGFFTSAEWGCFLALGWPTPTRIFDCYAEFVREINGKLKEEVYRDKKDQKRNLLQALSYHGIFTTTSAQYKDDCRELILGGGPWTTDESERILTYCQADVDPLVALFERQMASLNLRPKGLRQATLRGRYMPAVAHMEYRGVPIDTATLKRLRTHWGGIKLKLVGEVDAQYGVYEGTTFKRGLFARYLARNDMQWPRTASGRLAEDGDTFRAMLPRYPHVRALMELKHALDEMKLETLAVGPDGRNRTLVSPFGALTSRNTPSNTKSVFGPAVWLRGLIKPDEGRALANIDWSSQEIAIAAALSKDQALLDAVTTGDPYMVFARMAGLAPPDATKETHPDIREMCKTCMLGIGYGMGAGLLSLRTGLNRHQAADLLARVRRAFPVLTDWLDTSVSAADVRRYSSTVLGWTLESSRQVRPTTQRNFPIQANAAEMMRLACIFATESGIPVCWPIHDALLIEADADKIDEVVAATRAAMAEASAIVLRGLVIDTDVKVFTWPNRYMDEKRGRGMWDQVMGILDALE